MTGLILLGLLAQSAVAQSGSPPSVDPLKYVDPLIGTSGGGNVFAGATLPYGMAKAVADTDSGSRQGGFTTDGSMITGFSSMHDSGTGGSPSLGLFPLFPFTSCANDTINGCALPKKTRAISFVNDTVNASLGFFSITLQNGIRTEMTAAPHTALYKFTFPAGDGNPAIILDLSDLSDSRQDNATISVDPNTGRMTGHARFVPSFGTGSYTAYVCTDFLHKSTIRDTGIYVDSRGSSDVKNLTISRSINGYPLPGGAFIRFSDRTPVLARVGLSLTSSEQACQLAEKELPEFDLGAASQDAQNAWSEKLNRIQVSAQAVNESLLTNFYSSIYRTMINPQNYTGVTPNVSSTTIYYDSFYCIWDQFRTQFPFLMILDPTVMTEIVNGLLTIYDIQGWLPDCHMSLNKGLTQGGSNADVVMADAYLKLDHAGIDWEKVYSAVTKDAEKEPFDWCCQGRGGLDSWKTLNYIPVQDFDYKGFGPMTRSISRTLEYSYNDFCIAEIAAGLGKQDDYEKYRETSGYWANLFRADQKSYRLNTTTDTGFTGFFQPRFLNQTWGYQNPLSCSFLDDSGTSCSLQNNAVETYESSIWEYSFYVPHDQGKLIASLGGPEAYVRRLDYLHDQNITYIGNEPSFLTVVQYHYVGRPGLSAKRIHYYIPRYFDITFNGLPGNDDSGVMGAFVAFSMMGLSTIPGQNVYLITPPFFESVNITHPTTGKTASIRNVNFDPSYNNIYIQNATLNGKPYTKNWIDHSFFTEGKELVLTLGGTESSTWGTRHEDLPPSVTPYGF